MSKNTYKPKSINKGSHIQMFLDSKGKHFVDVIRETTYNEMLLSGGRKHSEFMQPYLNPDYPSMDYLWPDISLFGDLPGANDAFTKKTGGGGAAGAYRFQCIISCEAFISGSMCETIDALNCYYGAMTGDGNPGSWFIAEAPAGFYGLSFTEGSGTVGVYATPAKKWKNLAASDDYYITVGYNDVGSESGGWYYHPIMDKWIYIEAGKSTCYYDVSVRCPSCPPEVEFEFDDGSTSDTIDPDSTIYVYVLGGLEPFTWVTSSMGYQMLDGDGDNRYNRLHCDGGSCGVDYDPYAVIDVTDACETSLEIIIRNTAGKWKGQTTLDGRESNCGGCGGACATGVCTSGNSDTTIISNTYGFPGKWVLKSPRCVRVPPCKTWCKSGSPATGSELPPGCPTASSCLSTTDCTGCGASYQTCVWQTCDRFIWGC